MTRSIHLSKLVIALVVVVMLWGVTAMKSKGDIREGLRDPVTLASVVVAETGALLLGAVLFLDSRRTKRYASPQAHA